ncbi:MAG TPA: kinase, partial [Synergistaceae bacterium]|nr:kinase [Synergistaceae bacterium]
MISQLSKNSLLSWEGEPRFFRRHRYSLFWGTGLLLGWAASLLATAPAGRVLSLLEESASWGDSGYLFFAAGILVLTNTARAALLYVGWFFTADGIAALLQKGPLFSLCIAALAIPLSYSFSSTLASGTVLHFGVPAFFGIATVVLLQYLIRDVPGHITRALVLGLLLFSFQWLDVIPLLTPYGFGRGELSMAVKQMAHLLDREDLLNLLGGIAFLTVLAGGAVTTELLVGWNRQIFQLRRIRTQERELARLREERLRSRS